jgi:ParB family chromosome partitioning protein
MSHSTTAQKSRLSNPAIGEGCDVRHIEAAHLNEREAQRVAVDSILPSPWQPRSLFEHDDTYSALVDNIRVHGLIQPVAVRSLANGVLELIAGHRRLQACRDAGHQTIPAFVHLRLSDASARAMTIAENLARKDLFPL